MEGDALAEDLLIGRVIAEAIVGFSDAELFG
jgi:hypothetical protein